MRKKIRDSDIIITHGGIGTIVESLNENKIIIIVPRLKRYNEAIDDHQCEIMDKLSECNVIIPCRSLGSFETIIQELQGINLSPLYIHSLEITDITKRIK